MRRKLLLAQALAHAPALLVLDEPPLGLDPDARLALRALLAARAAGGTAVVLGTHDVAEAERLCHRVIFLHRGRPVLEGAPEDLLRAMGEATRIEIELSATRAPDLSIPSLDVLHADTERLRVRSAAGTAPLPALCAALLEQDAAVRTIRTREPDLAEVFFRATGAPLDADGDARRTTAS